MRNSIEKNLKSYGYAMKGLIHVIKYENNIRYQLLAAAIAVGLGVYQKISQLEWLFVSLAIGLVLMAEVFNTALERLVDLVHPERNPKAGIIKDISAGAVLVISITALLIGLVIFLPEILTLKL